jgi:signal transduction histidine kinase
LIESINTNKKFDVVFRIIKNGEIRFLKGIANIYRDSDGVAKRMVGVNWDITDNVMIQEELKNINLTLETRVQTSIEEIRNKDKMLLEQSRLAIMGEMIGNIAHQWRQPLNAIGLIVQDIQDAFYYNECTTEYIDNNVNSAMKQLEYMSHTIDDFRNFFKPNKAKDNFNVVEQIEKALSLTSAMFDNRSIKLIKEFEKKDLVIFGYPNEYSQVILNILSNSKDAIIERDIKNPFIIMRVEEDVLGVKLTIEDNAGGIPANIINKIFDPYFTTKHQSQGTGLGLYMSKMIIEKNMSGKLFVANTEVGVRFEIII